MNKNINYNLISNTTKADGAEMSQMIAIINFWNEHTTSKTNIFKKYIVSKEIINHPEKIIHNINPKRVKEMSIISIRAKSLISMNDKSSFYDFIQSRKRSEFVDKTFSQTNNWSLDLIRDQVQTPETLFESNEKYDSTCQHDQ